MKIHVEGDLGVEKKQNNDQNEVFDVQWAIGEADANAGWSIISEPNDPGKNIEHEFLRFQGQNIALLMIQSP